MVVQKKRTKEKYDPDDASTRPKKNKKITKSSPPYWRKRRRLFGFSNIFFIHARAGPPSGYARTLYFYEIIQSIVQNHLFISLINGNNRLRTNSQVRVFILFFDVLEFGFKNELKGGAVVCGLWSMVDILWSMVYGGETLEMNVGVDDGI